MRRSGARRAPGARSRIDPWPQSTHSDPQARHGRARRRSRRTGRTGLGCWPHGTPALRLLLRRPDPVDLDDGAAPRARRRADRHGRFGVRRSAAGALPAARPVRRRHHLAATDLDRAVRRTARARRGDAAGAPQLLRGRRAHRRVLDVHRRGAAPDRRPLLPGRRGARGHLRRGPVDGWLRGDAPGTAPPRTVRRGRQPVRRARRSRARGERPARRVPQRHGHRRARPSPGPTTTCSPHSTASTPPRLPRCTCGAAPRTGWSARAAVSRRPPTRAGSP